MAETNGASWRVLPHSPITRLADNLWSVEGSLEGMTLKRVMTVARRTDSTLVIHGAIAMDEERMTELEALGEPAYLVVPSQYHRLDAPAYKVRYPALRVFTPRGAQKTVQRVVAVDGTYDDFPSDDAVRLQALDGMREREGAMVVRSTDGTTVVLNDAVFNMDAKKDVLGYLFTTVMGSAPGPRVSRLAKLALISDQTALRQDLERLAATDGLVRLIVAHEKVAHGADARAALIKAATYLR